MQAIAKFQHMETVKALIIFLKILLVGIAIFYVAIYSAQLLMKREVSVKSILKDFRQKIWMTLGLGFSFFGLYLLIIYFGSFFNDSDARLNFFVLVYKHPIAFIYLGLLTFACVSIGIYLVRMVIKYFYNKRRK